MIKQLPRNIGTGIVGALPLKNVDVSEIAAWVREHPLVAAGAVASAAVILGLVLRSRSNGANGHLEAWQSYVARPETPWREENLRHRVLRGVRLAGC